MNDLLDDITLASITPGLRRGQLSRGEDLQITYIRDLVPADIEVLNTVPLEPTEYNQLKSLRATHHSLARLLASGVRPQDAAQITGHSVQRVYMLQNHDRSFIELIEFYKEKIEEQFVDTHARLAILGLATIEELQERLEVSPGKFTNNELFKMAEMLFDRSSAPSKGAPRTSARGTDGSGVNISVTFVSPKAPGGEEPAPAIDVTPQRMLK